MAIELKKLNIKTVEEQDDRTTPLAPKHPFRMMAIGKGASGKTHAIIGLIENFLTFDQIFVYSKYLESPEYTYLREQVIEKKEEKIGETRSLWSNSLTDFVPPTELNNENRSLYLFDDMIAEAKKLKDSTMAVMFTGGRHGNASTIAIMQAYVSSVDPRGKQCIEQLALFKGISESNLDKIRTSHEIIFEKKDFLRLYRAATAKKYGFLYIDFTHAEDSMRYRFKFDGLFNMGKFERGVDFPFEDPPASVKEIEVITKKIEGEGAYFPPAGVREIYKQIKATPDQIRERVKLIIGESKAGNDNPDLRKELLQLLKHSIEKELISEETAARIFNSLGK